MAIRAVFVGGGKMAEAMVNGMRRMLPAGAAFEFEVEVCDPNEGFSARTLRVTAELNWIL